MPWLILSYLSRLQTLYESLEACTSRLWSPDQLFAVSPSCGRQEDEPNLTPCLFPPFLQVELDLQSRILHTDIITSRAVHVSALMEELAL